MEGCRFLQSRPCPTPGCIVHIIHVWKSLPGFIGYLGSTGPNSPPPNPPNANGGVSPTQQLNARSAETGYDEIAWDDPDPPHSFRPPGKMMKTRQSHLGSLLMQVGQLLWASFEPCPCLVVLASRLPPGSTPSLEGARPWAPPTPTQPLQSPVRGPSPLKAPFFRLSFGRFVTCM